MAEGILKAKLQESGVSDWRVESAGTNRWHKGGPADPRSVMACKRKGLDISKHVARRVTPEDFERYDILYSMAVDVNEELREFMRNPALDSKKVRLFLDELEGMEGQSVPDPWYGEDDAFDHCYDLLERACDSLMKRIGSGIRP
jgi:protein-tyrosine phosphatase